MSGNCCLQGIDDHACIFILYGNAVTNEPSNQCLVLTRRLTSGIREQGLQLIEISIDPGVVPDHETTHT